RSGDSLARLGPHHLRANGDPARSGSRQRAAAPAALPRRPPIWLWPLPPKTLGRSATGPHDRRRRKGISGALGGTSPQRWCVSSLALAGSAGPKTGPKKGRAFGGVRWLTRH